MKPAHLKLIGYAVLVVLILNIVLFAFVMINWVVFWTIIAVCAVFVYKVLPKLKK